MFFILYRFEDICHATQFFLLFVDEPLLVRQSFIALERQVRHVKKGHNLVHLHCEGNMGFTCLLRVVAIAARHPRLSERHQVHPKVTIVARRDSRFGIFVVLECIRHGRFSQQVTQYSDDSLPAKVASQFTADLGSSLVCP